MEDKVYSDYMEAKEAFNEARMNLGQKAVKLMTEVSTMPVAKAFAMGLVRFNFDTSAIPSRVKNDIIGRMKGDK